MLCFLRFFPLHLVSHFMGRLAELRLPQPISTWAIRLFCRLYRINLDEVANPIDSYKSLAEFFTRDLKANIRKQGGGLTSPVDGCLRDAGPIIDGTLPQIKEKTYSLETLLQDRELADRFKNGSFVNLYLAPPDYHHVHAPISAHLTRLRYIPGAVWPVNNWALSNVPELFTVNERVVMLFEDLDGHSASGAMALVMVGALNVAKISLAFDPLVTHTGNCMPVTRTYTPPLFIDKGQRVGTFHLGSTVVLLFEKRIQFCREQGAVKLGDTLSDP